MFERYSFVAITTTNLECARGDGPGHRHEGRLFGPDAERSCRAWNSMRGRPRSRRPGSLRCSPRSGWPATHPDRGRL